MYTLTNTRANAVAKVVQSNGEAVSLGPLQSVDVSHLTPAINAQIAAGDLTFIQISSQANLNKNESIDLGLTVDSYNNIILRNPKTGGAYGDKIRSAIHGAFRNNSYDLPPLASAPTYTASTIYGAGSIVRGTGANSTHLYLAVGSTINTGLRGTSGAASPPTGTGVSSIVDNNIVWFYIGEATASSSYPLYSSVSPAASTDVMNGYVAFSTTSLATLGLNKSFVNNRANPVTRFGGLSKLDPNQAYSSPLSGWDGTLAGGAYKGSRAFLEFTTNAQKWLAMSAVGGLNGAYGADGTGYIERFDISINGRFLSESPVMYNVGFNYTGNIILDLSQFGPGNKTIRIVLRQGQSEYQQPYTFTVRDDERIWPSNPPNNLFISVEGDSLGAQSFWSQMNGRDIWEQQLMTMLGFNRCINTSVGGTSTTNISNGGLTATTQGQPSAINTTFGERIRFIAEIGQPNVHVITGFNNDIGNYQGAELTARRNAILKYFRDCRTAFPNALIVVVPAFTLAGNSLTTGGAISVFDLENDAQTQFNTWADTNSLFVPMNGSSAALKFWNGTTVSNSSWNHCSTGAAATLNAGSNGAYGDGHLVGRFYLNFSQYLAGIIRAYFQDN